MAENNVLEHFRKICTIPHCSYEAQEMQAYLVSCSESYGYSVSVDAVGNILAKKEGSSITLQSHYDMVCIGVNFPLELYEEKGLLLAKDSTLGADNGMGMAMMLSLMQDGYLVDVLFTAEEEVGLIGARGLELDIAAPYMLNLDSEEEGVVTIGCAGGVDIIATKNLVREKKRLHLYRYEVSGLVGGHSGVDIDKNIPNAISLLFQKLCDTKSYIVEVHGGERRNSIPKKAEIVFGLEDKMHFEDTTYLGQDDVDVMGESCEVIALLAGFDTGVRLLNEKMNIVETSINLALIESSKTSLRVQLSGRSMDKDALVSLEGETIDYFTNVGFEVVAEGFYTPWKPEENSFAAEVLTESQKLFKDANYGAIHAGLECGIIKEKYPHILMASIGPNIYYPHSNRESVSLDSVALVYECVKNIVRNANAS